MRSYLIIALLVLCAACQKKDNTTPDAGKVTITIASPQQGQTYHSSDTVYINADVRYVSELHGYEVMITDTATGFVVYDNAQHGHADHFAIADKWVYPTTQRKALKLTIQATVDHNGTVAKQELYFEVTP